MTSAEPETQTTFAMNPTVVIGFEVAGVGELARELVAAARAGGAAGHLLADAPAAADWMAARYERLGDGDLVLVKGSRGIGLEVVVERIRALGESAGGGCD